MDNGRTETEARECWCPMARADNAIGGTYNRGGIDASNHWASAPSAHRIKCIGSACMAWRWGEPAPKRASYQCDVQNPDVRWPSPGSAANEPRPPASSNATEAWAYSRRGHNLHWIEPSAEADTRRRGYCGLAGSAP